MTAREDTGAETGPGAPAAPPVGRLGGILGRGAGLSAAALVVVQTITLVQTLVLARLLDPEIVGVFAAGTVLTAFLTVFTHGTLAQALIQREQDFENSITTVFWMTLATGAVASLGVLAVSPLLGRLFGNPQVADVAAVMSGVVLLTASTSVPDAVMQRRFQFSRRLVIDPAVAVTFAVTAATFAALGFGVWALAIGTYASLLVWVLASWFLARCNPFVGRFSYRLWREMAVFSYPLLLDGLAFRIQEMVQLSIIGRGLDAAALGNYRYGSRIAQLPALAVVQVCSFVLFPAFSRIAGDAARFRSAFLRSLSWIWRAAAPTAALMVAVGEPVVVVLLGEPWRDAGTAVAAMFGVGLGVAMNSVTSESLKGSGRSGRMNYMTAAGILTGIPLLLLLLPLGIAGVGLAVSAAAIAVGVTGLAVTKSVVGVSWRELARILVPPAVASVVALVLIGAVERGIVHSDTRSLLTGTTAIVLESVALVVVYLAVLRVLAPAAFTEIVSVPRRIVRRVAARRRGSSG